MLQADEADRKQRILKGLAGPCGDYPPFTIEYSSNLLEYCAAQDIPNFGVHAFYALSREPLSNWDNITNTIFPRGIGIRLFVGFFPFSFRFFFIFQVYKRLKNRL